MRNATLVTNRFSGYQFRVQVLGRNRNEFGISLALFVAMNALYYFGSAIGLSSFRIFSTRDLFVAFLFRPGLDLVCWVCALNAMRDKDNMWSGERIFCRLWFAFLCVWNLLVLDAIQGLVVASCLRTIL